jgi:hypothetical protein
MITNCPRCQRRISYMPNTQDYVHECNSGNNTLDQEDVLVIGNWEDYTGSENVSPSIQYTHGTANELQGTRAGIEGKEDYKRTARGKDSRLYRTRQHLQWIKLKKN